MMELMRGKLGSQAASEGDSGGARIWHGLKDQCRVVLVMISHASQMMHKAKTEAALLVQDFWCLSTRGSLAACIR